MEIIAMSLALSKARAALDAEDISREAEETAEDRMNTLALRSIAFDYLDTLRDMIADALKESAQE